jgi:Leucine-rich repeat (LRR) protein
MSFYIIDREYKIENATNITYINEKLTEIPKTIFNLVNLIMIDLRCNYITSIPTEIKNLINLEYLCLSYNCIKEIHKEIGSLVKLKKLFLNNNKLLNLPIEIGNLVNLERLQLEFNLLTSLPKELSKLDKMEILNVECNKIKYIADEILKIKNSLIITDSTYDIQNLDFIKILIFSDIKNNVDFTNLPITLKAIIIKKNLITKFKKDNIKLPFNCKIKYY